MANSIDLIVACASNRVIGRETRLPWSIPEDHRWFHELTAGRTLVLGRICYETWPRAHTQGRVPIVITSRSAEQLRPHPLPTDATPARLARTVPEALAIARQLPGDILVCGGQRIFEETLPICDRLYLTEVHAEVPGDVFFPEWRHLSWRTLSQRSSEDAGFKLTFSVLERIEKQPPQA